MEYTASAAFLDALSEAGVSYIFANFGSDHPGLIEAIAQARAEGKAIPAVITAPFEMVGLAAAQGYAQVSGRAQAVVVHVECGTQSLAGAVHNVAKGRAPVLIFAGLSPATQDGEAKGSRNEFIQWIQDVFDQRGIVREYMKYDNEFRSPLNVKPIVRRALQIAASDPKGPVYLVGAREIMEASSAPSKEDSAHWRPIEPGALAPEAIDHIVSVMAAAQRPVVVTSYLGRNPAAVPHLVAFCEAVGAGVLESVPSAMNFPHSHDLYQGGYWNHPYQNPILADADAVLVIDSDVPWIPTVNKPSSGVPIFHIDVDPLKEGMPLWYLPIMRSFRADGGTALRQLVSALPDGRARLPKHRHYAKLHAERAEKLAAAEVSRDRITIEHLLSLLRPHCADAIVLSEGITNYPQILDHLAPDRPGAYLASGGGSLGWGGGAAIGAKLAAPDKLIVAIGGDGCYMFSVPSSVHWMARRYQTPFLQIVLNNGGWKAPRFSALQVHPDGFAAQASDLDLSFDPAPDYSAIAAAAGGAYARQVKTLDALEEAIQEALYAVREEKRCAVLDVWLDGGLKI